MSKPFRISEETILRDSDCIAFHRGNGCVSRLNEPGYTILLHFSDGQTIDGAAASVSKIFSIDTETAKNDVAELVTQLVNQGILEEYAV